MTIDPNDLSNLYFDGPKKHTSSEFCVNPKIEIQTANKADNKIVHGRGMVAIQDIAAGECLFVSPPTVGVNVDKIKCKVREESNDNLVLEEVVMDDLIDQMMQDIESRNDGEKDPKVANTRINSFLGLMGSTRDNDKEVTIEMLNGQDETQRWYDEELQDLSRNEMKDILLKNAFGPDFITYDKMETQWRQSKDSDQDYTPPNMLGVFPLAAMINHSCTPNAVRTFANGCMVAHACQAILAGTEVVWSYIPPTQTTVDRKRAIKKRHGFVCKCERCMMEAKESRRDLLPANLKQALEEANRWNDGMLDVSRIDEASKRQLCASMIHLEETIFSSKSLSNEVKRHVRVGYTDLHLNYFNTMLMTAGEHSQQQQQKVQAFVLQSATQLHFAYCSSNNTSTEHLSVLHLCYELASASADGKFWTETMKRAHMTRYGSLGSNLASVRNTMVHTRTILRQREGYLQVKYNFL